MTMNSRAFRAALMMAVALPMSVLLVTDEAAAQASDLGSVTVTGGAKPAPRKKVQASRANRQSRQTAQRATPATTAVAITSDTAVGSGAPAGSAPALAPSQGSLTATQPMSVVSDKILRDVVPVGADYNETAKVTPGFLSDNSNGAVGDSKSGWRGYKDGQFNITFDGIPFGDANDPTHHSAAYFPASFLSRVVVDRGPGYASQVGYATFGGTLSLNSLQLSDKKGASVEQSFGNNGTFTTNIQAQSGAEKPGDTKALIAVSRATTDGALQYGEYKINQGLIKIEKQVGDLKVTALASGGTENYNNTGNITRYQWAIFGKSYGAVNGDPRTQQYVGYNNSKKATDLEYIHLETDVAGFKVDNKAYTYSYWYPSLQNNGSDQSLIGVKGTGLNTVKVPTFNGSVWGSTTYTITGVAANSPSTNANGDVVGYVKNNNYRAFGDILNLQRDLNLAGTTGVLKGGVWFESISNDRKQEFADYTTGALFPQLTATPKTTTYLINGVSTTTTLQNQVASPTTASQSYKLLLNSQISNIQPFIEYEWHPTKDWTITPGYKYESFTRNHLAAVNQTTLQPADFQKTYTANLPFLSTRYSVTDNLTVYGQASKGFLAPTVSAYYVYDSAFNSGSIAPQSTTNYQIGAVYKTEDFTVSGDVYRVTATNFPVTTTATDGTVSYSNGGTAQYQGLELEGTYKLVNNFAAYASGALISAKYVEGGNKGLRVGDAPSHTLAGGLIYDDQTFFASLIHRVYGSYYGSSGQVVAATDAATNTLGNPLLNKVPSWNSTDLAAGVRTDFLKKMGFGEKAQLKIGVSNLFNHRDITEISGSPAQISDATWAASATDPLKSQLSYTFQAGRTFYVSAKVDF